METIQSLPALTVKPAMKIVKHQYKNHGVIYQQDMLLITKGCLKTKIQHTLKPHNFTYFDYYITQSQYSFRSGEKRK